jgi:TonB-dependent starch-binding outer membrane protein SusC
MVGPTKGDTMGSNARIGAMLGVASLIALAACGGRGLPEAGPKPGEVDVGYDTQPEEKVTGAVTSVSEKELSAARPLRLEELLRGKVAGLEIVTRPDGREILRIRGGVTSLAGGRDQDPLVIVDGVPIPVDGLASALAGLTPEDIKQVDVLKDVASTSIYGMRGAAGVILITTRR